MGKTKSDKFIKTVKIHMPDKMEYQVFLRTDKDTDKFIKRCEKIIRSSMEYKDYISFLREHMDMSKCAVFQNVSSAESKRIKIEIHHEPFTLYDYVAAVVERYKGEGIELNDLAIAEEVMELHYNNMVGLIPLSKTLHQMVHNSNKLKIPLSMVYGDYSKFMRSEKYEPYIEELYTKLENKINETKNLTERDFDAISKEFTYIEMENVPAVEKQEIQKDEKEELLVA